MAAGEIPLLADLTGSWVTAITQSPRANTRQCRMGSYRGNGEHAGSGSGLGPHRSAQPAQRRATPFDGHPAPPTTVRARRQIMVQTLAPPTPGRLTRPGQDGELSQAGSAHRPPRTRKPPRPSRALVHLTLPHRKQFGRWRSTAARNNRGTEPLLHGRNRTARPRTAPDSVYWPRRAH